ncbi:MAG: hypothetical protein GXP38_03645 [Chloroflexi bacterium]|nr:hypothetical protein [Chloroflexota bacterium]
MMKSYSGTTQPTLLQKLLYMLSLTEERELGCAEVFELMDYYVELEQAGENVQMLLPQLAQHFRVCPDCAEEYEALCAIMKVNAA